MVYPKAFTKFQHFAMNLSSQKCLLNPSGRVTLIQQVNMRNPNLAGREQTISLKPRR